ncbi:silent information regulator protein Sir2 [bacterium]|nr:silent information regulator protein Sir2 [bacterium]
MTEIPGFAQSNIPPNYGAYRLNPEYNPDTALGWADKRVEEKLGRGLVAVHFAKDRVYLSWRLLKEDPTTIAFNIYRSISGGKPIKLNTEPITRTTDFVDTTADLDQKNCWQLVSVLDRIEGKTLAKTTLAAGSLIRQYQSFLLKKDVKGRGVHKIGIGDLNGDGEYDFVIKRPGGRVDPGTIRKSPDTFKIEGYTNEGVFLWRNDLGWSVELGTWYSPMVVFDFNGDSKAEVALKTAEGDHREPNGQVLSGPEYCSVWNGETGEEITRINWIPRGNPEDWGDTVGNRMNRNMMGVAYLDGKTPALLILRGIYGLMRMEAWLLRGERLLKSWSWTNQTAGWKYQGQGQHNIHVADIDNDGCDEILYGSIAIDHDGRLMWSTGLGHGDRFYISDIDPGRPGLEVWYSYEDPHPQNGVSLWDAATGDLIVGTRTETKDNQIHRVLVSDIDPGYPGMECWATDFFYTCKGEQIPGDIPPLNGLVWWDEDPLRELEDRGRIMKWKGNVLTSGIEGHVMLWADLLGDWREEIVTVTRSGEIRIYITVIPARDRRICLMQNPLYRIDVALKAMGYDQVPMTSYYLGEGGGSQETRDKKQEIGIKGK